MSYVLVRKCVLLFQLGIRRASIVCKLVYMYAMLYGCMHAWIYRIDT